MKSDKSKKIFDAIGNIGDDLVSEAEGYDARRERIKRIRIAASSAASFVIVAAAVLIAALTGTPGERAESPIDLSPGYEVTDSASRSSLPDALKNVKVISSGAPGRLIGTDDKFIIETSPDCDAATISEYMTLSPRTNVTLTNIGGGRWEVSPASGGLYPGTVYNFSFGDPDNPSASYSFQTERRFEIKSALPCDMATDVPVNSGIELTFTEALAPDGYKGLVTIEPEAELEYRLYPNGKTLAVVPKSDLEYGTVYKVTVGGVKSVTGAALGDVTSFTFMTEDCAKKDESGNRLYIATTNRVVEMNNRNYRYSLNYNEYIFFPGEEAAVSYYLNSQSVLASADVRATLYKYADVDSAAETIVASSVENGDSAALASDSMTKVGTFECVGNEKGGTCFLGTGLDRGIYLVALEAAATNAYGDTLECTKYVLIQISGLRAFTISSNGETLVRVDAPDGAARGASVTSTSFNRKYWYSDDDGRVVKSDSQVAEDGVCTLSCGDAEASVITVRYGDDAIVVCAVCNPEEEFDYSMSYLFTDREVYFSNDKISFSGAAILSNGAIPSKLFVKTALSPAEEIEVSDRGFFSGTYAVEDQSAGGFYLTIVDGDENVVASKYVRVTEEEKPKITADITFDKLFYRYGDEVTVTLRASFFDGTPAEGFKFTLTSYPFGADYSDMTTDSNGEIKYSITTGTVSDPPSTFPSTVTVSAELTDYETQKLYVTGDVYYFHSDYVFGKTNEGGRRRLTLNHLDTSALKTSDDFKFDVFPENTVGEAAEGTVGYVLKKYETVKTEKRSYDYNAKKSYTYYEYNTVESTAESGTLAFENGVIDLPAREPEGFEGGYYYIVTYNDGRNTYSEYISASGGDFVFRGYGDSINVTLDRESYRLGDVINAVFDVNGDIFGETTFALYDHGLDEYTIGKTYTGVFDGDMISGATLFAVAYDAEAGAYVYGTTTVSFDPGDNTFDVEILPDREKYLPGDTATVTIKAPGAAGADAVLAVVDEACLALGEQNIDLPSDFFSSTTRLEKPREGLGVFGEWFNYYYGRGATRSTDGAITPVSVNRRFDCSEGDYWYRPVTRDNAAVDFEAETGNIPQDNDKSVHDSEGDVHVRRSFADCPVFSCVTLDESGEATLIFTIPDNITSWRLTALVSDGTDGRFEDAKFGNATANVVCSQEFFISLNSPEYYVVGDDAALTARTFGASQGDVTYTATLAKDGKVVAETTVSDASKGYVGINFGKQDEGHYVMTVYAKSGDAADALESEFDVIPSAEVMLDQKIVQPDEIKYIKPSLYPLTLTFFDSALGDETLNSILFGLSHGDGTERADSLAARYSSLKAIDKLYGSDHSDEIGMIEEKLSGYGSRMFSLFTYSEDDLKVTYDVLLAAPEVPGAERRSGIRDFIYQNIAGDDVSLRDFCMSIAILAALDEPVLDDVYKAAERAGTFPADCKLYVASAAASLGDWQSAYSIYSNVMSECGRRDDTNGWIKFNDGTEDAIYLTSLALNVASKCCRDDAGMIAKYLNENRSKTETVTCSLAHYAACILPEGAPAEKHVTYRLSGEEITSDVTVQKRVTLKLSKAALGDFEVVSFDEGVSAAVSYFAPAAEVLSSYDVSDRVKISKSIEPFRNGMYKVNLVISGTSTRVYEDFSITDVCPSGTRFFESYGDRYSGGSIGTVYTGAWLFNPAGQKVSGHVWVYNNVYSGSGERRTECPEYSFSITVSYVIRGAATGEFVAEPAVVCNLPCGVYNASERYRVTVSDGEWTIDKKD